MIQIDPDTTMEEGADQQDRSPTSQDRFELRSILGAGGSGKVYKAWDHVLKKSVAVKMIGALSVAANERLRKEAAIAQKLTHPSIVRIHDVTTINNCPCISMELVDGPNLAEILRMTGTLPQAEVLRLALDVCLALDVAHAAGVIHCDIKPGNLLVTPDRTSVADFGIAVLSEAREAKREIEGTKCYMSPEQLHGLPFDHTTDLYSLGLVMFECLAGRPPSKSERSNPGLWNLPRSFEDTPKLAHIITKCLEPDRNKRYQSAADLHNDLSQCRSRLRSRFEAVSDNTIRISVFAITVLLTFGITVLSVSKPRHVSKGFHVAITSPGSNSESLDISDSLDEFAGLAFRDMAGVSIWQGGPGGRPVPQLLLSEADLVISITTQRIGSYLSANVEAINQPDSVRTFAVEIGGKSIPELQYKLWDALITEPHLRFITANAVRPKLFEGRDPAGYNSYALGLSLLMRNRKSHELLQQSVKLFSDALRRDKALLYYARRAEAESLLNDLTHDPEWSQKAVGDSLMALSIDPNSEEALLAGAKAQLTIKNLAYANALLQRGNQLRASAGIHKAMGYLLAEEGLPKQAISELSIAAALNPIDLSIPIKIGLVQLLAPDYDAAAKTFLSVLRLDPQNASAKGSLASSYLRAAKFSEALPILEDLVRAHPQASTFDNLGIALFFTGKPNESLLMFKKAAESEPTSSLYVGNLAHAYRWMRQNDLAAATYRRALTLAMKHGVLGLNAQLLADIGLYKAALGLQEESETYTEQARAADPIDLDVLYKACVSAGLLHMEARKTELLSTLHDRGYPFAFLSNNPDFHTLGRL